MILSLLIRDETTPDANNDNDIPSKAWLNQATVAMVIFFRLFIRSPKNVEKRISLAENDFSARMGKCEHQLK